jgi:tRNA(fMet)-specific endonuclease VapC
MEVVVCDTNILIDILKGDDAVVSLVEGIDRAVAISSITGMELFFGALNKRELHQLEKFVQIFRMIHLNEEISSLALDLERRYAKSHNLTIPDALIAATAMVHRAPLLTHNLKDFRFIEKLKLYSAD